MISSNSSSLQKSFRRRLKNKQLDVLKAKKKKDLNDIDDAFDKSKAKVEDEYKKDVKAQEEHHIEIIQAIDKEEKEDEEEIREKTEEAKNDLEDEYAPLLIKPPKGKTWRSQRRERNRKQSAKDTEKKAALKKLGKEYDAKRAVENKRFETEKKEGR